MTGSEGNGPSRITALFHGTDSAAFWHSGSLFHGTDSTAIWPSGSLFHGTDSAAIWPSGSFFHGTDSTAIWPSGSFFHGTGSVRIVFHVTILLLLRIKTRRPIISIKRLQNRVSCRTCSTWQVKYDLSDRTNFGGFYHISQNSIIM